MADTVITQNNQQVRFRGRGDRMKEDAQMADPAEEGSSRATDLHRKGLISDKALQGVKDKAKKAKAKAKGGLPKIERQEDSENARGENDSADAQIEGDGAQKGVATGPGKNLANKDDDGDHEFR